MRSARVLVIACLLPALASAAENTDPGNDQSQYVWSENAGWINAEPGGDGSDGMQVEDFELAGWLWGENVGWISLSCKNTASCSTVDFGIVNDGTGTLMGHAWSESAGWIDLGPTNGGVAIDPVTGEFSGDAWSENLGWIRFASSGPHPFTLKTAWTCNGVAPPTDSATLSVDESGSVAHLSWSGPAGATGHDVVRGSLQTLRSTAGDFAAATEACVADNLTTNSLDVADVPPPDEAYWFLVRGTNCAGIGTYDPGPSDLTGPRDTGVAASGLDCADP